MFFLYAAPWFHKMKVDPSVHNLAEKDEGTSHKMRAVSWNIMENFVSLTV